MENTTSNWPDLAIGLYEKLTDRNAKINYEFDNLEVNVPSGTASEEHAKWTVNGRLSISTQEK
ncbi:MAG: hypothetical protein WBA74_01325 [Cyclobacteriaceae bacterium]